MNKPMIFPDKTVAGVLAKKMGAYKGYEFTVKPVPTGFQVVSSVQELTPTVDKAKAVSAAPTKPKTPLVVEVNTDDTVTLTLQKVSESAEYFQFKHGATVLWFAKSNILKLQAQPAVDTYDVTITKALAKKRKLIA